MNWEMEKETQYGWNPQDKKRVRLELDRCFFLIGLFLALVLQVYFQVFLFWGLIIFEGISALAALILKIIDENEEISDIYEKLAEKD